MKKLFVLTTILAGTLIASSAYSQVYVNARVRIPGVRVVLSTPPPPTVVYQQYPAPAPAPVYQDGYSQDQYQDGYGYAPSPTTVVYENDFPGYAYYNYPVWNGHFRDRVYYEHYRPYFERDNRAYFNGRRFDNARFQREHFRNVRGGYDHGGGHRGRW
ncbi:MAG TPA: hypothetical protein VHD83_20605 [Puia sp.]|nr:hypothetical protein [Puia sp.]